MATRNVREFKRLAWVLECSLRSKLPYSDQFEKIPLQ